MWYIHYVFYLWNRAKMKETIHINVYKWKKELTHDIKYGKCLMN